MDGRLRRHGLVTGAAVVAVALVAAIATSIISASPARAAAQWSTVSAGHDHACGVQVDHTLWCWGEAAYGQLGLGRNQILPRTVPTRVGTRTDWSLVYAGGRHTCALTMGGVRYCWGQTIYGALGMPQLAGPIYVPTSQAGEHTWWVLTAGSHNTCGMTAGRLYCWGDNLSGTVGINSDGNPIHDPTQVGAEADWATGWFTIGDYHACALKSGGQRYCWGENASGQLGIGHTVNRRAPGGLANDGTWTGVTAGALHTCGLRPNDQLLCWGGNTSGQLGLGDVDRRTVPAVVGNQGDWRSVEAGTASRHTCALKNDGRRYCWGSNSNGQLGVGDTTRRLTPTRLTGEGDWLSLAVGATFTCGLNMNRSLYCWGDNYYGQLGLGDTTNRTLPTAL
jgi:alpha-tubulin suppressor-like RCC1 family protein